MSHKEAKERIYKFFCGYVAIKQVTGDETTVPEQALLKSVEVLTENKIPETQEALEHEVEQLTQWNHRLAREQAGQMDE